jgi:hypothetical protein
MRGWIWMILFAFAVVTLESGCSQSNATGVASYEKGKAGKNGPVRPKAPEL